MTTVTDDLVRSVVDRYPADLADHLRDDIPRQVFHANLVAGLLEDGSIIADLGGGLSPFLLACSAVGMSGVLIDDFGDPDNDSWGDHGLQVQRSSGIQVLSRDVIKDGLGLPPASVDVVASFDSMEHWHHSPKALFADVMRSLRSEGWFVLGVPNCVNLRKRLTVPLGRGKWSAMEVWYELPQFRGHVREPDVDDLLYIARDMGLCEVSIVGRNWQGLLNRRPWIRRLTPFVDSLLQRRPTLCSDIYLLGRKPPGAISPSSPVNESLPRTDVGERSTR